MADAVVMIEGPSDAGALGLALPSSDQRDQTFVATLAVTRSARRRTSQHDPFPPTSCPYPAAEEVRPGMYDQGETRSVPSTISLGSCASAATSIPRWRVRGRPRESVRRGHGRARIYTITGAPAGSYRLRVWHERLAERTLPVTVRDGAVEPVDVKLGSPS